MEVPVRKLLWFSKVYFLADLPYYFSHKCRYTIQSLSLLFSIDKFTNVLSLNVLFMNYLLLKNPKTIEAKNVKRSRYKVGS